MPLCKHVEITKIPEMLCSNFVEKIFESFLRCGYFLSDSYIKCADCAGPRFRVSKDVVDVWGTEQRQPWKEICHVTPKTTREKLYTVSDGDKLWLLRALSENDIFILTTKGKVIRYHDNIVEEVFAASNVSV